MTRFARGAVVARDRRFGVVWLDDKAGLVLLPILRPKQAMRHDVELQLCDLIACGAPIDGAVLRPRCSSPVRRNGQLQVGTVPPALMCRVIRALVLVIADLDTETRWAMHRQHVRRATANLQTERD